MMNCGYFEIATYEEMIICGEFTAHEFTTDETTENIKEQRV